MKFYLTSIQENRKFIYFGAIIFSNTSATKIAKLVDGKVDLVLVDIEKKAIDEGITDADAGNLHSNAEASQLVKQWLKQ